MNEPLLAELLADDQYLARRPPKSTGFEMYGDDFVARAAARHGGYDTNLMATLTEFTAKTIMLAQQCAQLGPPVVEEVIAAGGGVNNTALMQRIVSFIALLPPRRPDDLRSSPPRGNDLCRLGRHDSTGYGCLPSCHWSRPPKLLVESSFP